MGLYRGAYRLAHMSQVLGRDECEIEIRRYAGKEAHGYMLTDEQYEERERTGQGGLPYRFLVRSPASATLSWKAFYTREELQEFLEAYACMLDCEPSPGESFTVRLPGATTLFSPLVEDERVKFSQQGLRNRGFLLVDGETEGEALVRAQAWLAKEGGALQRLALGEAVDIGPRYWSFTLG